MEIFNGNVITNENTDLKVEALRWFSERYNNLGIEGACADLGCGMGDMSALINELNPDRKLYLYDTFTGYDANDIEIEKSGGYSDAGIGDFDLSKEDARLIESKILDKMKNPENVIIKKGWFPKSTEKMKSDKFVLVYIDTGLFASTYNGIQYFYPRLCRGGVIMIPHYKDEKMRGIKAAIDELEEKICPFIMMPLCDKDSTVMISRP